MGDAKRNRLLRRSEAGPEIALPHRRPGPQKPRLIPKQSILRREVANTKPNFHCELQPIVISTSCVVASARTMWRRIHALMELGALVSARNDESALPSPQ